MPEERKWRYDAVKFPKPPSFEENLAWYRSVEKRELDQRTDDLIAYLKWVGGAIVVMIMGGILTEALGIALLSIVLIVIGALRAVKEKV